MGSFGSDLDQSQIVGRFLDEHLYPEIGSGLRRVDNLDDEYDGIDLRISIPGVGEELLIDEKMQADYINGPTDSFILELSYPKDGLLKDGWFYDGSKRTEYYLFGWIPQARDDSLRGPEDIVIADCLLIDRFEIQEFLVGAGYPREQVEQRAEEIRESGEHGHHPADHPDFFFYFTVHKDEQPVNIVMKYRRLHELSVQTYRVSSHTYEEGMELF